MSWIILVEETARHQLLGLDPSLRAELIEHVDAIAAAQGFGLGRSHEPAPLGGLWLFEYESAIVNRLVVRMYFSDLKGRPGRLVLRAVLHEMLPDESID